jgi:SAM-dependent methyltransferase
MNVPPIRAARLAVRQRAGREVEVLFESRQRQESIQDMVQHLADWFAHLPAALTWRAENQVQSNAIWAANRSLLERIEEAEAGLSAVCSTGEIQELRAYSTAAGREVDFIAPRNVEGADWREALACPFTGLINRSRASVDILQRFCGLSPSSRIYLSEQDSPLFRWIRALAPGAVGSEYRGPDAEPGSVHDGIRHESLTQLSFPAESFDLVGSFDCLEHIPDYRAALSELARVLAPGGSAVLTFPFTGDEQTLVRASVDEHGAVTHHCPPEYHGDPVGGGLGILCYYHFGHDVLQAFRSAGFSTATLVWLWSGPQGNLGGLQGYFVGRK